MSKKGAKKQPAMAATLEEIMRMLMEERAQRETAMERREQRTSPTANDDNASAYGITVTSSK